MGWVLIWIAMAFITASFNAQKGHSYIAGLVFGFILGPIALLSVWLTAPNQRALDQRLTRNGFKKCFACATFIRDEALICPHCRSDQRPPMPAAEPEPPNEQSNTQRVKKMAAAAKAREEQQPGTHVIFRE